MDVRPNGLCLDTACETRVWYGNEIRVSSERRVVACHPLPTHSLAMVTPLMVAQAFPSSSWSSVSPHYASRTDSSPAIFDGQTDPSETAQTSGYLSEPPMSLESGTTESVWHRAYPLQGRLLPYEIDRPEHGT